MNIKEQLETLKAKEMDRKEFLKYGLTIVLAVVGVTGLVRTLVGGHAALTSPVTTKEAEKPSMAYGASAYGR